MTSPTDSGADDPPDMPAPAARKTGGTAAAKPDDSLISWFKSFKYFALLTGIFTAIWALFPSFYLRGYLGKFGIPVSTFPVDSIDVPVALHHVLMSLLVNFFAVLPSHKGYLVTGGLVSLGCFFGFWFYARKHQGKRPLLMTPKWRPSPAVVGLGAAAWLAMVLYLVPRAILALLASLLFLPYIAEYAGNKDAEREMARGAGCVSDPAYRPVECVSIRYEEKGLDGKEHVEQIDGLVVIGNTKLMAILTLDGETRLVPAGFIRLSSRQSKSGVP
ncbi:hypothetical protein J2X16_003605 [Pelomonas aquatica]|uniref:Uncharacterized protein n=1 Tax=Pelomonas aquatica TaxID=431058 RepID=A0ABU1ZC96_9BURK|nr:hypothetical protein [Pelomonas aquatica]MDR7298242.1 hypothetical protein [Pelomonas aquatica]